MEFQKPKLIEFKSIGESAIGFISVGEAHKNLPFVPQRVFWTYFTPESVVRGHHAHYQTEMVLVAVAGRISVFTETPDNQRETFVLDRPQLGLYLPPYCWHTMQYSHTAVQLVLASHGYDEKDYIRDYADFQALSAK